MCTVKEESNFIVYCYLVTSCILMPADCLLPLANFAVLISADCLLPFASFVYTDTG